MPIANCYIRNRDLVPGELSNMVSEWARIIEVDTQDVCVNVISGFVQLGKNYTVLVDLNLPSVWQDKEIRKIQVSLLDVLQKYLEVPPEQIFIMTNIIHSGRVVENGEIVVW
jgi:hypothetical protein